MRLAFRIALRFLSSNKGQTALIALGIAIGISVQIFIGSLIEGLQISLLDATIGRSSHITISAEEKSDPLEQYAAIEQWLLGRYPQITALSPSISNGGFIQLEDSTEQIIVKGFDLEKANAIYHLDEALVSGYLSLDSDEVLIGAELASENEIKRGDWIDVLTPGGRIFALKVVGVLDLNVASLNRTWVVSNLDTARRVFNYEDWQSTNLEMQITEPFESGVLVEDMKLVTKRYPARFDDWQSLNAQLLSGLSGQSSSSLMIQVFVVISVVLGIASVLAISVLQKSKQLGILKAMGISDGLSSLVFLFQGFMLGILGGLFGIVFGLGLLWSFSKFALKPDGTPVVPIFINYGFIALSGGIAIGASTLAAIVPALKSRRLSPIEVIKNG